MKVKISFSNYLDYQFFKTFFYWVLVAFTMLVAVGNPPKVNVKELLINSAICIIWLNYLEWFESKFKILD